MFNKKEIGKQYLDFKLSCIDLLKKDDTWRIDPCIRIDYRIFEELKELFIGEEKEQEESWLEKEHSYLYWEGKKWTYNKIPIKVEKTRNAECIQVII